MSNSTQQAGPVPQVPANELIEAKELGFNEFTRLANLHGDNPYKLTTSLQELFARVYSNGFNSGYRQKEMEGFFNDQNPE